MVIDQNTGLIICLNFCNAKKHDFRLYKESNLIINPKIQILADTAYKSNKYPNIQTPHKKPPKKRKTQDNPKPEPTKLTKRQKQENKEHASKRVKGENIIGDIKVFKINSERYRNRRKRYGLRMNLTCGLLNFELMQKINV